MNQPNLMETCTTVSAEITVQHRGRFTQIMVSGSGAQLKNLCKTLVLKQFILTADTPQRLVFRRPAYLVHDDWPMRVVIYRDGQQFDIRYSLLIPWPWIIGFALLLMLVLPFAGIQRAELILLLGVLAVSLASYKQQFDGSPNAPFWQAEPRRRWGQNMEQMVRDAFDKPQRIKTP